MHLTLIWYLHITIITIEHFMQQRRKHYNKPLLSCSANTNLWERSHRWEPPKSIFCDVARRCPHLQQKRYTGYNLICLIVSQKILLVMPTRQYDCASESFSYLKCSFANWQNAFAFMQISVILFNAIIIAVYFE